MILMIRLDDKLYDSMLICLSISYHIILLLFLITSIYFYYVERTKETNTYVSQAHVTLDDFDEVSFWMCKIYS